jgi:predicted amidohydrolase YtcJ
MASQQLLQVNDVNIIDLHGRSLLPGFVDRPELLGNPTNSIDCRHTAAHSPFPNLYTSTTRRSAIDPSLEAKTNEHVKVDLFSTMTAVTRGAAYSMWTEHRVGTIEIGKQADLLIADLNWKEENNLLQAKTHETWFDGRRVYARNDQRVRTSCTIHVQVRPTDFACTQSSKLCSPKYLGDS